MPDEPVVVKLARQFKANVDHNDRLTVNTMANSYVNLYRNLNDTIVRLADEIRNLPDNLTGELREQWVRELHYYQRLQALASSQVGEYSKLSEEFILQQQKKAILQGLADAETLMKFSVDPLGKYQFTQLPKEPLEFLNGVLGKAGNRYPLGKLLDSIKGEFSPHLDQILFNGLALGKPTNVIARELANASTMPLSRATTIARTEINRAYRLSTAERYRQSPWVKSYKRIASKSGACMACLLLDGMEYPVDVLEDHPNGACAMVPIVTGATPPEWEYGADYFQKLPEDEQQARMGKYYWKAWKDGEFRLEDMIGIKHSPIWGNTPSIRSLKTLMPHWRAKYFGPPQSYTPPEKRQLKHRISEVEKAKWKLILENAENLPYEEKVKVLKIYEDHVKTLNQNEKDAIKQYTMSSYIDINDYLRHGKMSPYGETKLRELIGDINTALENAPPTPDWILVKRGLDSYDGFELNIGDVYEDIGFVSTSKSEGFYGDIKLRILVPPNSKGVMDIELLSNIKREKEVLFGSGAKFACFNKTPGIGNSMIYDLIYIGR